MIDNDIRKEVYDGDGSTVEWAIPFDYSDTEQVKLYTITDNVETEITTNFSINNNVITYPVNGAPVPEGTKVLVIRKTPLNQLESSVETPFTSADVERALDKLTCEVQEVKEDVDRALKSPEWSKESADALLQQVEQKVKTLENELSAETSQRMSADSMLLSETNSKMPLAGGTFTGDVNLNSGISLKTQNGRIHEVDNKIVIGDKSSDKGLHVSPDGETAALIGNTVKNILTNNDVTSEYSNSGVSPVNGQAVSSAISTKQDTLVSGTNIKTINNQSLLGSGNITIDADGYLPKVFDGNQVISPETAGNGNGIVFDSKDDRCKFEIRKTLTGFALYTHKKINDIWQTVSEISSDVENFHNLQFSYDENGNICNVDVAKDGFKVKHFTNDGHVDFKINRQTGATFNGKRLLTEDDIGALHLGDIPAVDLGQVTSASLEVNKNYTASVSEPAAFTLPTPTDTTIANKITLNLNVLANSVINWGVNVNTALAEFTPGKYQIRLLWNNTSSAWTAEVLKETKAESNVKTFISFNDNYSDECGTVSLTLNNSPSYSQGPFENYQSLGVSRSHSPLTMSGDLAKWNFGLNPFKITCWVLNSGNTYFNIFSSSDVSTRVSTMGECYANGVKLNPNTTSIDISSWTFLEFGRGSDGIFRFFVNGVQKMQKDASTVEADFSNASRMFSGYGSASTAYMSDFVISAESVSQANYTRPTTPFVLSDSGVSDLHDDTLATKTELAEYVKLSTKGIANGVASLDEKTKVPLSQLPVDSSLDATSENPVQNKVIYAALGDVEALLHNLNSGNFN